MQRYIWRLDCELVNVEMIISGSLNTDLLGIFNKGLSIKQIACLFCNIFFTKRCAVKFTWFNRSSSFNTSLYVVYSLN